MIYVPNIPLKDLSQKMIMEMYLAKLPFRLENGGFLHYDGSLEIDVYSNPNLRFPVFGTLAYKGYSLYNTLHEF